MAGLPPITQLAGNHRVLFEGFWALVDQAGSGSVPASIAAEFLKKSQLRESVLHKIWDLSDPTSTGSLDKQGFFMALRLVAACQKGKEANVTNIALTDPPPRFNGIDHASLDGRSKWSIDKDEQTRYEHLFQSLIPTNGLLSGDKARPFMLSSKLPMDVLGKVWNLSDIDKDGSLDKDEFSVAMKLISLAQGGETLPPSLPSTLIPPSKTKGGVSFPPTSMGAMSFPPTSMEAPLNTSILNTSIPESPITRTQATSTEWVVPPEAKAKYDTYFQGIDKDHDGIVSGDEARTLFMASNLPPKLLAHVWHLCDIDKTGKLNGDQFALAMFLIAEKVRGKEVPTELTPAMIPPALRKQTTPPNNTPTHSSAASSWASPAWSAPGVAMATSVAIATSASSTSTAWSTTPTSLMGEPMATTGEEGGGFGSDFSSIMELDTISKEVDTIRKEKSQLSEEIKSKQELILSRQSEVEGLQNEAEASAGQRERLEKERAEAQERLEELDRDKGRVDREIAEMRRKCEEEQKEIDRLKETLSAQQVSKASQTEELEKLRVQLEALRKEEKEYKDNVEASAGELDKLQKAHQNIQTQISQTRQKIDLYKEEHQSLSGALAMYPPISTPSSTRSSSVVNISDMALSHLPSELNVPHISEPDAISARATAGSSSPVSSISGFSTNSHMDDGGEDSSGKGDDKRTGADPFTSTHTGSDPFAAFSLPPDDPFAVNRGGGAAFKPSDLSAFDPFGTSDPFKATSSAPPGDNLFKSDPFASSSAGMVKASAPSTMSGGSTDPFSGQDPFSSDPFASIERKDGEQLSGWSSNAFSMDPFASQGSTSDPFSSDPFGDDPFSRQGNAGEDNPFNQPAPSANNVTVPEPLPQPGPHASNTERLRWAQRESEREQALRNKRQVEEEDAIAKAIRESMKKS